MSKKQLKYLSTLSKLALPKPLKLTIFNFSLSSKNSILKKEKKDL